MRCNRKGALWNDILFVRTGILRFISAELMDWLKIPLFVQGIFFVVPDMRIRISWTFSNLFFLFF